MDKISYRLQCVELRKKIPSLNIPVDLLNFLLPLKLRSVHIYRLNGALNEVDTAPIIAWLRSEWPHIEIYQPELSKEATMYSGYLDIIFVPVVGFDSFGNRIGMGGGWYDTFLATHPTAVKIGLAYDECEVQKIEPEPHDVRLDYVVTPTRVIECVPISKSSF